MAIGDQDRSRVPMAPPVVSGDLDQLLDLALRQVTHDVFCSELTPTAWRGAPAAPARRVFDAACARCMCNALDETLPKCAENRWDQARCGPDMHEKIDVDPASVF